MVKIGYSITLILAFILGLGAVGSGVQAQQLAKQQFGAMRNASTQEAAPFGSYAKGCIAGAEQLPETGPTWQAMARVMTRAFSIPASRAVTPSSLISPCKVSASPPGTTSHCLKPGS